MSGGVLAPVWLVGAAAVGVGVAIGATAAAAGAVTVMGSVAAYEQIKLAKECSVAVRNAKAARADAIKTYMRETDAALCQISSATRLEIQKLKTELEKRGFRINLSQLGHTDDEVLIRLMELSSAGTARKPIRSDRAPAEIVKAVCSLIDPLLTYIPSSDEAFHELTAMKESAVRSASASSIPIAEKTRRLLETEKRLLSNIERFKRLSRKYEYDLAQFTSLAYANKKLAEACGETVAERRYSAENAQAQIRALQSANADYLKKLREKMKSDKAFIEANHQLAALVEKSILETGCRKISVSEKDFGIVGLYTYRSSLLRVTVSREGMLSMDLIGRNGESKRQVKADERFFCAAGLESIQQAFENNGIMMQADSIRNLTDDTIIFEGDLDFMECSADGREETEPRHMYIDESGGVVA